MTWDPQTLESLRNLVATVIGWLASNLFAFLLGLALPVPHWLWKMRHGVMPWERDKHVHIFTELAPGGNDWSCGICGAYMSEVNPQLWRRKGYR